MSEEAVKKYGLEHQAVEIIGQAMATDMPGTFEADKTEWAPWSLKIGCFFKQRLWRRKKVVLLYLSTFYVMKTSSTVTDDVAIAFFVRTGFPLFYIDHLPMFS